MRYAAAGGVLAGIGLGGFLDGIVLHQILQWHNMLSSLDPPTTLPSMQRNMLWDGLFHAFTWIATFAAILLLWAGARSSRALPPAGWLLGLMLVGWGLFNFVEGLVDHHLLAIHHVRGYGPDPIWDYGFLLTGPAFVVLGLWLARRRAEKDFEAGGRRRS